MSKNKILSKLQEVESELKETELQEYLNLIENRHSFHLGLILGLVFAVVAGFFAIIVHEIFIVEMSFNAKLAITIFSGIMLLFCLYLGLTENRTNKNIRKQMWEYIKAGKKGKSKGISLKTD